MGQQHARRSVEAGLGCQGAYGALLRSAAGGPEVLKTMEAA